MNIKELRLEKGLTQTKCAEYLNIPLRTYQLYESNEKKISVIKYNYIISTLKNYNYIDEEHGILRLENIKKICKTVFDNYNVKYCYLFGSYAKNLANENSDVDLLIDTEISGIQFYELVEVLREKLHKKIDLLNINQIKDNFELTKNILSEGIKIYEQC